MTTLFKKEISSMLRKSLCLIGGFAVMLIAGCASTNSPTADTSPAPSAAASPSATASPTGTTDPCQLVTAAEASSLAGASYGAGLKQANTGGSNTCIYGYQTLNVFMVTVAIASDAATAQAEWAQEESQAQAQMTKVASAPGVTVNISTSDVTLTGADRAAVGTGTASLGGHTFAGAAVYALKGAIFFTFSDLTVDHAAPTSAAMQGEAETVVTRLP
jgi:hypothetical protein